MTDNTTEQPTAQTATPNQVLDFLHQFPAKLSGPTVDQIRTYDAAIINLRNTLSSQLQMIKALQAKLDAADTVEDPDTTEDPE